MSKIGGYNTINNQQRIGVIVGGTPEELNDAIHTAYEVSKSLEKLGKHVEIITFDDKFETAVKYARLNAAFIIDATYLGKIKIRTGLRDILEKLAIPYTGSSSRAALITKNKVLSKKYFEKGRLLTLPHVEVNNRNLSEWKNLIVASNIEPPYVIKPRDEGSGIDVFFVETVSKAIKLVKKLLKRHKSLIIEKYVDGVELTVPVLEIKGKPTALATIEVEKKVKVLSNDIKFLIQFSPKREGEKIVKFNIPANISKKINQLAIHSAVTAHEIIGCRGYSRIDMIANKAGDIYVLEINSLPTLSEHGLFTRAAKFKNIFYNGLIENIVQIVLSN